MTDKELEKIYKEAYKAVYWTAMSLLKNEADAEDVVQETFITLIKSYESIKDKTKVMTWLKKTAANKCLDRIKLSKTDAVEVEFFENVEAVPEDFLPDMIVESAEMRKIIMDIIGKSLSDDIRRTLILFYFDEMSTKEIAEALGVPEGTVRRRLNFARNKIKKEVEKYEDENKTKLFGMAALPFLSKLFIAEAEQVPFKAMPAKLISLSASAQASNSGAITKIAAPAAKKGTRIIMKKVIIGIIAAVAVTAATAGIVYFVNQKDEPLPEEKYAEESVPDEDIFIPDNSELSVNDIEETTGDTDVSVSDEPVETTEYDITQLFDPNATVLTGTPTIMGYEVVLPVTVGELKDMGFTCDGIVYDGRMTMDYEYTYIDPDFGDEEQRNLQIECFVEGEDFNSENVNDDAKVYGIFVPGMYSEFVMGGIEIGMGETQFIAATGTPAYMKRTDDQFERSRYIFLDENNNAYEFTFIMYIGSTDDPLLESVSFASPECWKDWRINY